MMNDALKKSISDKSGAKHVLGKEVKYSASMTRTEMLDQLEHVIDGIEEVQLRNSLRAYLSRKLTFLGAPSSGGYHHAYENGNLEHTLEVVKICLKLAEEARMPINNDVLIAGAILHDIGKEQCYEIKDTKIEDTQVGKLVEHISLGIEIAGKWIESKYIDKIIHVIASHHNLKEWGSPVQPQTSEAWIVHLADMFSAKLLG